MTQVTRRQAAEILGYSLASLIAVMRRQPGRWPAPTGQTRVRGQITPTYDLDAMRAAANRSTGDEPMYGASSLSDADGIITCLECGRRFRFLAPHLRRKHGITPDEYRVLHHLPATASMHADVSRRHQRDIQRRKLEDDPTVFDHLKEFQTRERLAAMQQAGVDAVKASRQIPLAQEHRLPGQQYAARQMVRARLAKLDRAAREHGFEGLDDAVTRTMHLNAAAAARAIGVSPQTVRRRRAARG